MTIKWWAAALAILAVTGVSVGGTLLVTRNGKPQLPPGCAPTDRQTPGCRPLASGTSPNTVALATVILTPLGALIVAGITVRSARNRLETQLAAEAARLKQQLEAETDRERARLDHERQLEDRRHLRDLLDEAAGVFETSLECLHQAYASFQLASERDRISDDDAWKRISNEMTELRVEVDNAEVMVRRLHLRYPGTHEMVETYTETVEAVSGAEDVLMAARRHRDWSDEDAEQVKAQSRAAGVAWRKFATACAKEIGVVSE
jgi:uncharacterized protein YacL (UPF0231 family)